MPRVYKIKVCKTQKYSKETLEKCLEEILDDKISINKASKVYNIPKGTLINRVHGRHGKSHGGQPVFSEKEEEALVAGITDCAEWGFPLCPMDLRYVAKAFLDSKGAQTKFKNNFPGPDWAASFLGRHKEEIKLRLGNNIKRARAAVDHSTLSDFHDELAKTLDGVSPEAIFNYDESNLSDDPGKQKLIFKRGVKYPDNVVNYSKSSVSIMMCISATGEALPPYVVYKATNMWDSWREGGPKGAPFCSKQCCCKGSRYNRTNHGWFDSTTFNDWFEKVFIPHSKLIEGRKVLIGDNLSSHFTDDVLKLCRSNNISFVCLPPNATHLCQPLDVSFFAPLKKCWREILTEWKKANPNSSAVEKGLFPRMLKKLFVTLGEARVRQNAISGFSACGICPLNKQKLLQRLPPSQANIGVPENGSGSTTVRDELNTTLVEYLQQLRKPKKDTTSAKRRKLNVVPGKSVAAEDTPVKDDSNIMVGNCSVIQKISRNLCDFGANGSGTTEECSEIEASDNEVRFHQVIILLPIAFIYLLYFLI